MLAEAFNKIALNRINQSIKTKVSEAKDSESSFVSGKVVEGGHGSGIFEAERSKKSGFSLFRTGEQELSYEQRLKNNQRAAASFTAEINEHRKRKKADAQPQIAVEKDENGKTTSVMTLGYGNKRTHGNMPGNGPVVDVKSPGKLNGDLEKIGKQTVNGLFGMPNSNSLEQTSNKKLLDSMSNNGDKVMKSLQSGDFSKAFRDGDAFSKSIRDFKGAESSTMSAGSFNPSVMPIK